LVSEQQTYNKYFRIRKAELLGLDDSGLLHSELLVFCCWAIIENKVTSPVTIYSRRSGPFKNLERSKHIYFSKGF
jgi:hypothetical protein